MIAQSHLTPTLSVKQTYLMGIVNLSPDSFSGDGVSKCDEAVDLAMRHLEAGADILDLGGESTRPGFTPVPPAEQLRRVLPVLRKLRPLTDKPISIDSTKMEVWLQAIDAGANIINSTAYPQEDQLQKIADLQVPFVVMHNERPSEFGSVVDEVLSSLEEKTSVATACGIAPWNLIIDPGIGFGKDAEQNLKLLSGLSHLTSLGYLTMVGTSRKSFLGKLTNKPETERAFGTAATVAMSIAAGINIIRVHDVSAMRDVIDVANAVTHGWRPSNWTT